MAVYIACEGVKIPSSFFMELVLISNKENVMAKLSMNHSVFVKDYI